MPSSLEQLAEQARALSPDDRAMLAHLILESLHPPMAEVEAAWAEEVERRVAAYDRGEISAYPAEDVFAEARCFLR